MTAREPKCCKGFRQGAQSSPTKLFIRAALSRTTRTHHLKNKSKSHSQITEEANTRPPSTPSPNPGGGEDPSPQGADDQAAPSRGLEHAIQRILNPQSRQRPVSPRSRHYSNPEPPKKNVLEGMVRESRVRPPHPPPLPTPSPGGDEGPSPPRRRQRSHRCRGDGS